MLPTCKSPLGDGANRTRTPTRGPSPVCSVTGHHRVGQRANALDGHRYLVSVLQRANPRRCACEQHVAREQRHHRADVLDQRGHIVQQLGGTGLLPNLAVHGRAERQVARINGCLDPRAQRAERVEPLGPGPLTIPGLQVAGGHVVGTRIAEDDAGGLSGGHLAAQPADDHRQLSLEVDPLGELHRISDRVPGAGHSSGRLEEQHRFGGRLPAHLTCVIRIVLAHRHHLARQHGRQQPHLVERVRHPAELDALPWRERVPAQLGDGQATARGGRPGASRSTVSPGLPHHAISDVAVLGESRDAHYTSPFGNFWSRLKPTDRPTAARPARGGPGGPGHPQGARVSLSWASPAATSSSAGALFLQQQVSLDAVAAFLGRWRVSPGGPVPLAAALDPCSRSTATAPGATSSRPSAGCPDSSSTPLASTTAAAFVWLRTKSQLRPPSPCRRTISTPGGAPAMTGPAPARAAAPANSRSRAPSSSWGDPYPAVPAPKEFLVPAGCPASGPAA